MKLSRRSRRGKHQLSLRERRDSPASARGCTCVFISSSCSFRTFTCILYSDTCLSICGTTRCLQEREHPGVRTTNALLSSSQYQLSLQPVLLLGLLQDHVCLCQFGLQQLLFQISVLEDLLQVLQSSQIKALPPKPLPQLSFALSVCSGSVPPRAGHILK